jgi:hypothetical protein
MARDFRDAYALTFPTPLNDYADREFIMVTDGTDIRLIWQLAKDKDEMTQFGNLDIDDEIPRLPPGYDVLAGKKVAIVGCGSVGSKVAVSLARSGVGDFVLLDDDVLVRKNLVRNDLDWRNIGEHKADGVAKRIRMVRPASAAKLQRFRLSGQEATASTATVLSQVADCDLIVNPRRTHESSICCRLSLCRQKSQWCGAKYSPAALVASSHDTAPASITRRKRCAPRCCLGSRTRMSRGPAVIGVTTGQKARTTFRSSPTMGM